MASCSDLIKIFQLPCVAWWTLWALAVTQICSQGFFLCFEKLDPVVVAVLMFFLSFLVFYFNVCLFLILIGGYGWVYDPCGYVMIYLDLSGLF